MVITQKKPKKVSGEAEMTLKEANIRYNLLNILTEPKNCAKTDVYLYKNGAGRVNFWCKIENVSENGLNLYNYDIISYYFTTNNNELKVYNEEKMVGMLKI